MSKANGKRTVYRLADEECLMAVYAVEKETKEAWLLSRGVSGNLRGYWRGEVRVAIRVLRQLCPWRNRSRAEKIATARREAAKRMADEALQMEGRAA